MAKKHAAKKVARKRAKVKTPTKRAYTKRNPRLAEANARRAEERKAIHSDEENMKKCREVDHVAQEESAYDQGVRHGRNRATAEDPIASRVKLLENLQSSRSHLLERKLMNETEAKGIAMSMAQVTENIERTKRELRGLMPDIEASHPVVDVIG